MSLILVLLKVIVKLLLFVGTVIIVNVFIQGVAKSMYPEDEQRQNMVFIVCYLLILGLILAVHGASRLMMR